MLWAVLFGVVLHKAIEQRFDNLFTAVYLVVILILAIINGIRINAMVNNDEDDQTIDSNEFFN